MGARPRQKKGVPRRRRGANGIRRIPYGARPSFFAPPLTFGQLNGRSNGPDGLIILWAPSAPIGGGAPKGSNGSGAEPPKTSKNRPAGALRILWIRKGAFCAPCCVGVGLLLEPKLPDNDLWSGPQKISFWGPGAFGARFAPIYLRLWRPSFTLIRRRRRPILSNRVDGWSWRI